MPYLGLATETLTRSKKNYQFLARAWSGSYVSSSNMLGSLAGRGGGKFSIKIKSKLLVYEAVKTAINNQECLYVMGSLNQSECC